MSDLIKNLVPKETEAQMRHFYEGMGFAYLLKRREDLTASTDEEDQARVRVLSDMIHEYETKIRANYASFDAMQLEASFRMMVESKDPAEQYKATILRGLLSEQE